MIGSWRAGPALGFAGQGGQRGGASRSYGIAAPPGSWGGGAAAWRASARCAGGALLPPRRSRPERPLPCARAPRGTPPVLPAAACSAASPRTAPASRTSTPAACRRGRTHRCRLRIRHTLTQQQPTTDVQY